MSGAGPRRGRTGDWPPRFPHAEIDRLLQRLSDGAGTEDAEALLVSVAQEAQRLRSAVARLSTERLAAAEKEADAILAAAQAQAEAVRRRSLRVLEHRLDEADDLSRAVRRSFLLDSRLGPEEPTEADDGPWWATTLREVRDPEAVDREDDPA